MPKTKSSPRSTKKRSSSGGRNLIRALGSILVFLFGGKRWTVTLSLIAVGFLVYTELKKGEALLIEPFDVPEALGKEGYPGRVIANKLRDKLVIIQETSESFAPTPKKPAERGQRQNKFTPSWSQTSLDLKVPGAGISITSLIEYVASFFGRSPKTISGEIIANGDTLRITTRLSGRFAGTRMAQKKNLESLLQEAAEDIYKLDDPPTLAYYYYAHGYDTGCLETIYYCLENESSEDDARAYVLWGQYLADKNNYTEAIAKYKIANGLDPKDVEIYIRLANTKGWTTDQIVDEAERQRTYSEILATFEQAKNVDPNNTDVYINWGWALQEQGNIDEAIAKFEQAIKIDPKKSDSYVSYGDVLIMMQRYKEAIAQFEQAIKIDPTNSSVYHSWADVFIFNDQLDSAIAKYEEATKIDPRDPWAYFNWGLALEEQGKNAAATAKFRRAIEIDPSLAEFVGDEISGLQEEDRLLGNK